MRAQADDEVSRTDVEDDFTQPPSRQGRGEPPPRNDYSEQDFEEPELTTRPVRAAQAPQLEEPEPRSDTNETYVPDVEEGPTMVSLPSVSTARKRQKKQGSGAWLVVLAVGVLLVGGLGAVIALGLDGGRVMGLISPPPPPTEELGKLQPIQDPRSKTPAPPAPAPAAAPTTKPPASETAPAPAAAPTPAGAPSAPSAPAAAPEAAAPATAAPATVAATAASSGAVAEAAAPPPAAEPAAKPETGASPKEAEAMNVPDVESASAAKKTAAKPSKRTRRDSSDEDSGDDGASGSGGLTLVTNPYAKVYLGRRYLGDTPLFKVNLPSGKHSLKLVGADGRTRRLPVEIKTGETTALKLALDEVAQE